MVPWIILATLLKCTALAIFQSSHIPKWLKTMQIFLQGPCNFFPSFTQCLSTIGQALQIYPTSCILFVIGMWDNTLPISFSSFPSLTVSVNTDENSSFKSWPISCDSTLMITLILNGVYSLLVNLHKFLPNTFKICLPQFETLTRGLVLSFP